MNGKTVGSRGLRRAGALAIASAVAMLVTACGVVHVHFASSANSASARPATYQEQLAYAQCMRAHGLPDFPIPNPPQPNTSEGFSVSEHPTGNPDSPAARANDACQHLLDAGSTGTGGATAGPGA